jgi:hypothetical protein
VTGAGVGAAAVLGDVPHTLWKIPQEGRRAGVVGGTDQLVGATPNGSGGDNAPAVVAGPGDVGDGVAVDSAANVFFNDGTDTVVVQRRRGHTTIVTRQRVSIS